MPIRKNDFTLNHTRPKIMLKAHKKHWTPTTWKPAGVALEIAAFLDRYDRAAERDGRQSGGRIEKKIAPE